MKDNPEIRKIIRKILFQQEHYGYLFEGIDIDKNNKTVSFNPNHEDNVDTSIVFNPTYNSINGIPVISIFKRKRSKKSELDGNPLIYALKGKNGWAFKNPKEDIISLLRQFIRISEKIKPEYDAIITVPSSNPLNIHFLHRLNKIIKAKVKVTDYFFKLTTEEVYEDYVDWKQLSIDCGKEYENIEKKINSFFYNMRTKNEAYFSFRYIKDPNLRKYITKTMWVKTPEKQIEYAPFINDKNILILDDTISSGSTISETCDEIINSFTPKSITVITLFSKI